VADDGARPAPEHLVVGHISKPHGTKGEVFVWPLTDRPDEVFEDSGTVLLGDTEGVAGEAPEALEIERTRPFKRGVLVKFVARDDRAAVASLAGRYLLVPMQQAGPLEEDELFYHQLLDMEVQTVDGTRVGTVREVYETEPAHLLEVEGAQGKRHLIPFAQRIVKKVDAEHGRIVIAPPPGLLEL
jgi:16S rRNA processing protein RimM